jgi:hypothetical protein
MRREQQQHTFQLTAGNQLIYYCTAAGTVTLPCRTHLGDAEDPAGYSLMASHTTASRYGRPLRGSKLWDSTSMAAWSRQVKLS